MIRSKQKLYFLIVGLSVAAAGCATAGSSELKASLDRAYFGDIVTINQKDTVTVVRQSNVFELLQPRLARYRYFVNTLGRSPLVVLDGIPLVDGLESLRAMSATGVQDITMLRSVDATFRYGSNASEGAIVITTRRSGNRIP
jgi:hypothetical protein